MPRFTPHLHRAWLGFTLVEVLASIVILGLVGSIASMQISTVMNSYASASTREQLLNEMSIAMSRIDKELRCVALKSGSTVPNITSVAASAITWNTNYTLALSGTTLQFTDNGATAATLLSNVSAFSVQAYDESNAAMGASLSGAGCDTIRRLLITITMTRDGVSETLRNKIFLRCMVEGASA